MAFLSQATLDQKGNPTNKVSEYQPKGKDLEVLQLIRADAEIGNTIRNTVYREFNDKTLLQRMNDDQMTFNNYVPPRSEKPEDAWRAQTIRPITRNRAISIAAHVTSSVMSPNITAQNVNDEDDRETAAVMKDLMEYVNDQSDYDKAFVYGAISALVNPAVILYEGYQECYRTHKEIDDNGDVVSTEDVLDDLNSGFVSAVVPVDEIYIGNVYEHDIQRQPFVIWRRVIDWSVAKAKYGKNENFKKYVRPGLKHFIQDPNSDTFYQQYDEELGDRMVEETIYYNRYDDLEIRVVSGVLMDKPDQPLRRKDKRIPFSKTGYELIDEGRFFYYKSLVFKMGPDQKVLDTMYNMTLDGYFISLMPPTIVYGNETVNASVWIPGSSTTFKEGTKLEAIGQNTNLAGGMTAVQKLESSISESSSDVMQSGQSAGGNPTAYEIATLEQNAKTMLGLFGKMLGFLVKDFGTLRIGTILQYMTLGEIDQLASEDSRMKFKTIIMPEKVVEGKKRVNKIQFSLDMPDEEITEEEKADAEFKILEEEGGVESETRIIKVNPELFRKAKFLVRVTPDIIYRRSEAVQKALNLEAYDRIIASPIANQEAAFRDFLIESYRPGEADKYIKKQEEGQPMPQEEGETTDLVKNLAGGGVDMKKLLGVAQ